MRPLEKKGQNDILFLMLILLRVRFYLWLSDFFLSQEEKNILICQSFFALDPLYKEPFTQLHRGATQCSKKGEKIVQCFLYFIRVVLPITSKAKINRVF